MSYESQQTTPTHFSTTKKPPRPPMLSLRPTQVITQYPTPKNLRQVEEEFLSGSTWSIASRRGRRRQRCEDTFTCLPFVSFDIHSNPVSMFGIFDGHGGPGAATFVSKRLPQVLLDSLKDDPFDETVLENAFLLVDKQFINMSKNCSKHSFDDTSIHTSSFSKHVNTNTNQPIDISPILTPSSLTSSPFTVNNPISKETPRATTPNRSVGTTATMVVLVANIITIAHVGDSRAVLSNRNGQIQRLCNEHRLDRRDEQERVEKAGGLVINSSGTPRVNGVLALSRAIGDEKYKQFVIAQPETKTINLQGNEEFLVVASDGLWDVVDDETCVDLVKQCFDNKQAEQDAAKVLTQYAWDQGSSDDASVIVLDLKKYLGELQSYSENEQVSLDSQLDNTVDALEVLSISGMNKRMELESITPISTRAQSSKDESRRPW